LCTLSTFQRHPDIAERRPSISIVLVFLGVLIQIVDLKGQVSKLVGRWEKEGTLANGYYEFTADGRYFEETVVHKASGVYVEEAPAVCASSTAKRTIP
jgi:hypothetical protein